MPRWNDSASIYFFSRKLKESIRFEITARGNVPVLLQAYIAAAISVEHNQAAAIKGRPQQQQQQQRPPPPNRPPAILPLAGAGPMEVDGSRRNPGPLNPEERRRRADNNLCAYCGQAGHLIGTCALAARVRQARGTFPGFTSSQPPPPPGYFIPPPGFQFPSLQGPYPGPRRLSPLPTPSLAPLHLRCQKTTLPASRSLAGWYRFPPPLPLPLTLPSLPPGPSSGSRPAAYPHPRSCRFWSF